MESLEELRNRLLREERVQKMVRQRAYEIYQMRGGQPGWESHDWFQAEGEVLAFLLALESRLEDEKTTAETPPPVSGSEAWAISEASSVSERSAIRKVPPRKATTTKAKSTSASKGTTVEPAKKPASKRAASVKSADTPKVNRTRKSTKKEDQ